MDVWNSPNPQDVWNSPNPQDVWISPNLNSSLSWRMSVLCSVVLWIRMDPELLPGSGIIVPDPDPAKSERAYK